MHKSILSLLGEITSQDIIPTIVVSFAATMPLTQTVNVTMYASCLIT